MRKKITLPLWLVVTGFVFAEETVMINFSDLVDDFQGENKATLMDFSTIAGTRYTDEEKAAMQTSLLVPNWEVELTSSLLFIYQIRMSAMGRNPSLFF